MDVSQYLDIFVDETKEHIQSLNDQIMVLEKEPDNKDAIQEIFRAAHSLKGMAGTMGFKRMQRLTHDMEDVFSAIRDGKLKVNEGLVDTLFKALDAIQAYLDTIVDTSNEGTEDNQEIIDELAAFLNGGQAPAKTEEAAPAADAAPKKVFAPLKGKVIAASEISDPMFAAEALGKCAAIIPEEGRVEAPFDGTGELMYDTGHAVAVTSDDGIEVLIHIGVDTVKLDGKGFTPHCKTGDKVSKGDLLVEFDRDVIKAAGYDNVTPVIVTNTDDYTEVKAVEPGEVNEGDQILEII